jgi:hypothetical protein
MLIRDGRAARTFSTMPSERRWPFVVKPTSQDGQRRWISSMYSNRCGCMSGSPHPVSVIDSGASSRSRTARNVSRDMSFSGTLSSVSRGHMSQSRLQRFVTSSWTSRGTRRRTPSASRASFVPFR